MNKRGGYTMEKFKICSKCGAKIEADARFCTKCGLKITGEDFNQTNTMQGMENPQKKKMVKRIIIILTAIVLLAAVVFAVVRLAQNIAKENKEKKEKAEIENAITEAFDKAANATEYTCSIKANASTRAHVGSKSIDGTYTVTADAAFKDKKGCWKNGTCDALLISDGNMSSGGMDYEFETYITESGDIYTKKEDEEYKKMDASFTMDDLIQYMDEISKNYDGNKSCDGDTITINGTLDDGTDIYNSYINYLEAAAAEPDDYPVSGEMNYEVKISKSTKSIQNVTFKLPDVEKIWFGVADDELTIDSAWGEFNIGFKSFDDVGKIKIPDEIASSEKKQGSEEHDFEKQDSENKDLDEEQKMQADSGLNGTENVQADWWKKIYIEAAQNGDMAQYQVWQAYGICDVNNDGIPEIMSYIGAHAGGMYYISANKTLEFVPGAYIRYDKNTGNLMNMDSYGPGIGEDGWSYEIYEHFTYDKNTGMYNEEKSVCATSEDGVVKYTLNDEEISKELFEQYAAEENSLLNNYEDISIDTKGDLIENIKNY